MKKEYIIGGLVGAVIVLLGIIVFQKLNDGTTTLNPYAQAPTKNIDTTSPVDASQNKTYKGSAFEFQYSPLLTPTAQGDTVTLAHSVVYPHEDLCDMRDGAKPLDKITDFDVVLALVKKNLNETLRAKIPENMIQDYFQGNAIKVSPGFIDEYKVGNIKGYKITEGAEGCGVYKYYLPLSANTTLYITRSFVPEFNSINTNYQTYLKVPGIISPEQEEEIFKSILSSFELK